MSFEQIVTYIVAPLIAAVAAIWALIRVVIPRIVEARLEGEKDTREHGQRRDSLEQLSRLSDSAASHQVVAELLANSQDNEQRANEFIRTTVFNGIQDIARRLAQLENRQSLLTNLITGGIDEAEPPRDDFEAWKKRKINETNSLPHPAGNPAGPNDQ